MKALRGEDTFLKNRNISIFKVFELEVPAWLAPGAATMADIVCARDE